MDGGDGKPVTDREQHRRAFIKAGMGAVAVGTWVAPQILFSSPVMAGCTPITRLLEIDPGNCGVSAARTPSACAPSGWTSPGNDFIAHTCPPNPEAGGPVTITAPGCTVVEATAVKFCVIGSPPNSSTCVAPAIISGNQVTFTDISADPSNCYYTRFRIRLSCCT